MSLQIIQDRLAKYNCETKEEEENAFKEITQELALMGLARANFFKKAEFHGGTALRILHRINRFSEDLDFALHEPDRSFQLEPYIKHIQTELKVFGYECDVVDRSKTDVTIKKAFLKTDSLGKVFTIFEKARPRDQKIHIKFEVDTNPPAGAQLEVKQVQFPMSFTVIAKDLPSAFAGKTHALLCRSYVKGRDWYDFKWFIDNKIQMNYNFLNHAFNQQGPWANQNLKLDRNWLFAEFEKKIIDLDWKKAVEDILLFVGEYEAAVCETWNATDFLEYLNQLKAYLQ